MESCSRKAVKYLTSEVVEACQPTNITLENDNEEWLSEDGSDPESHSLLLPSSVPNGEWTNFTRLGPLLEKELKLREGQANDALQKLKESLSSLAWQFKRNVRNALGNRTSSRAWDGVHKLNREIQIYRSIYNRSRSIMIKIKGVADVNGRYPVITKEHCRASTVIAEPNARGQSNTELAWFWHSTPYNNGVALALNEEDDEHIVECRSQRHTSHFVN